LRMEGFPKIGWRRISAKEVGSDLHKPGLALS
jgi:hypothetical protein